MTAILTDNSASLQAHHPDQLHTTGHEPGDSGQPDEALRRVRETNGRPQGLARIVIRAGHPHLNGRPLVRFAPQHGACMGICPGCGEATQPGACPRCGALIGLAPAKELQLTAATCPRCGGSGCPVCSYRGQV